MAATDQFRYIREWNDEFLSLFPHRYDYIYAEHPEPNVPPDWRTESRYPLSDRILCQGSYLFGVRFGARTHYCLLDIDIVSPYHPRQDPLALPRLLATLEPLGLVDHVACTSSYSGGLHLYFPFHIAQSSWKLTNAVGVLLENAGFRLKAGQLEIFPNPKPYIVEGAPSLFNAHRLPLQAGSYLLNQDLQPVWSDQQHFVQQWRLCQNCNVLDTGTLEQVLKQAKRWRYRVSGKADKFINDLNAEIELGWTGSGQTNRLLGRITMRCYIFHHMLYGGEPLEGKKLVDEIVATARALPGYREWCRHQHEIEKRAEEWGRCIENSHYFHYGGQFSKLGAKIDESEPGLPTWNQRQSELTREKIRAAIADLLEQDSLPATATARFKALTSYGVGGGSLYRHRDLWHPDHLWKIPSDPPTTSTTTEECRLDYVEHKSSRQDSSSLLPVIGGNGLPSEPFDPPGKRDLEPMGGNSSSEADAIIASGHCSDADEVISADSDASEGVEYIHQILSDIKSQVKVDQKTTQLISAEVQQSREAASQLAQVEQMRQFLASGDPILIAEAQAWARHNPGVLNTEAPDLSPSRVDPTPSWPFHKRLRAICREWWCDRLE